MEDLQKKLASVSIKRSMRDISDKDIPEPEIIEYRYDMTSRQKNLIAKIKKLGFIDDFGYDIECTNPLVTLLRTQQITSGFISEEGISPIEIESNSIKALSGLVKEVKDDHVIIWYRFKESLANIIRMLAREKIPFLTINGETKDKGKVVKQFASGEFPVLLAQIQCSAGWDAPIAKTAIFYELDFKKINHDQAKGRIKRLTNMEEQSRYIYMIPNKSPVEGIVKALKKKDIDANIALELIGKG